MRRSLLIGTIVLLGNSACAQAQDWSEPGYTPTFRACLAQAGGDDDRILACTNAETSRQDAMLNGVYKRLSARISPYQRELLLKSERAWITFRDTECAFQGAQLIGGPLGIEARAQADSKSECLLRQTRQRVHTLESDYKP